MNYQENLVSAIENLIKGERNTLSSQDEDVLQLFSGDTRAAILALHVYALRHAERTFIIQDAPGIFAIQILTITHKIKGGLI